MNRLFVTILVTTILFPYAAIAENSKLQSNQIAKESKKVEDPLIFTAPPRGKKDKETYQPIVKFLTETLGRTVVYDAPTSWEYYNSQMRQNKPDIIFDGPHFNSWRMSNIGHTIIVKIPQSHIWNVIVADESKLSGLNDLIGKYVCLQGASNFAKLTFLHHFKNPVRQPVFVPIKSREQGYVSVVEKKCVATVVSESELKVYNAKYARSKPLVRALHRHKPYPNQAISVSGNVSRQLRKNIKDAFLSSAGHAATKVLRKRYANNKPLVAATKKEYLHVQEVLDNAYGFGYNFKERLSKSYN
ncbi:MAG: phosphate/phosphite/phosphonate ABC transporter substrate-binding protein [Thiohalomonadales bacterium]